MNDLIANIFELWGGFYMGDFSKYMYKAGLYGEVGLVVLLIPLFVFFIYYKPLDHIKTAKLSFWFILLLIVSLIVSLIVYNISDSGIHEYLMKHKIKQTRIDEMDYIWFSLITFVYSALLSFGFSCLFKKGADRTRRIPF